jgi:hypothetical protein
VRPCGPPKQRLWLGARQYCDCCRESAANTGSDSYPTGNGDSVCPGDNANTNTYAASCYSHTDADTFSYAYCYDATITDAYTYTYSSAQSNTKASADSASPAVSA